MKTVLKLFLVLVVLLALLVFVGVQFAPSIATKVVESKTGFGMDIAEKRISLLEGVFNLKNLKLENPDSFPVADFLDIKELGLNVDVATLLSKQVVIEELVLDLDKISWVKNKNKEVNLLKFTDGFKSDKEVASEKPTEGETKPKGVAIGFLAKKIIIRLGSASRMDYSGTNPHIQDYDIGYERVFTNITSVEQLMGPLTKDLTAIGVKFLADSILSSLLLDPKMLKDLGGELLKDIEIPIKGAEKALDGVFDMFKKH